MSYETLKAVTYLPDFLYGYHNGLKEVPPATGFVIEVADFGALPNDGMTTATRYRKPSIV